MQTKLIANALRLRCNDLDTAIKWGLDTVVPENTRPERRDFSLMLSMETSYCAPAVRVRLWFPDDFTGEED